MSDRKSKYLYFINSFELYIGGIIFVMLTVLLTLQVITRFVFNDPFTWAEELAVIMFVWLVYVGTSAAVLNRKHIRIETLLEAVPFKVKKVLLIVANYIALCFCGVILKPLSAIVGNLWVSGATTPILQIPKYITYAIIPVCMILTGIRFFQENIRLMKEDEENFGASEAMIKWDDDENKTDKGEPR